MRQTTTAASEPRVIREPAVAGLFYPKAAEELSKSIDGYLAQARPEAVPNVKGLICPHAGYEFSGPVAAFAYKLLVGRDVGTVVVLAPSHYAYLTGASIGQADAWRTPLGVVRVSDKAAVLAKASPFTLEADARVQRPGWWRQSSKTAPPAGEDKADTWEHSGEAQVPFLQKVLKDFAILPATMGEVDPQQAAKALAGVIDDRTVIVASSDLSHYHPYQTAKDLDSRCVTAICDMDIDKMQSQEACGKLPILTLMHIAKLKGWKARLLDYRNSGDTSGDKSGGVVGYAAIVFYDPAAKDAPAAGADFSPQERKLLLELARNTIKEVVAKGRMPEMDAAKFPKKFTESKGCFVTLTKGGQLRGCIGHIFPQEALYRGVANMAQAAATEDPRFEPVRPDELDKIEIEISVLTVPEELAFKSPEDLLAKLVPHRDGVVLRMGPYTATYLPQVWEQISDKEEFLNSLARKAGRAAKSWREPGTKVLIYHVEAFSEKDKPEK